MNVRPADAERFVARPAAGVAAVLLYGPNLGLVRDRAERLGRAVAGALDDPFRVADLAPSTVAADPGALADEAAALSMTGGRRLVRLRGVGNEAAAACETLLRVAAPETSLTVVEAGALAPRTRLRALFERAANAAAVACYEDDPVTLRQVVRDRLAAEGKQAAPAVLDALAARLGGDRKAALSELDKLVSFVGAAAAIGDDDVLACVGDGSDVALDDLADAVAEGDRSAVGRALDKLAGDGVSPVRALGALERHFQRLHWAAGRVAGGESRAAAVNALRPPVFFKRRRRVEAQLGRWSPAAIGRAMEVLLEAEIACKTTGAPAGALCARAAMSVAGAARRRL